MKKRARVTSKGQITVPNEVRRAMGIRAGDSLLFEQKSSGFLVTALRSRSPFEKFRGIGTPGIASGRKSVVRWVRTLRGR